MQEYSCGTKKQNKKIKNLKKGERTMKNMRGFTLVELIIVIVIVGILSIVAVPVYKGYTKKAMGTEAKSLIGSIATAERVYFAEWNNFFSVGDNDMGTGEALKVLDVDARSNKYFTGYKVLITGTEEKATFLAIVTGNAESGAENIKMSLKSPASGNPTLEEAYTNTENVTMTLSAGGGSTEGDSNKDDNKD